MMVNPKITLMYFEIVHFNIPCANDPYAYEERVKAITKVVTSK